jgi:rhamnosyltransferase
MNALNHSLAGTVVLYNPSDSVFDTILSYIDQVAKLYIVDNSDHHNGSLTQKLKQLDKVIYVNNHGNKGIAAALNVGAELALKSGFDFLLTMDQDTDLSANYVSNLMTAFIENDARKIGIIAPPYLKRSKNETRRLQDILFTMTSGNILNLKAYEKVGPFLNELFIDHVDHEYCLRLNQQGFRVVQVNDVEIIHRPGTLTSIFKGRISFSSHSPQRLYYFCRNGFYVSRLYGKDFPVFKRTYRNLLIKEIAKIAFEDAKFKRLTMVIKGYIDYRNHKLGKLEF